MNRDFKGVWIPRNIWQSSELSFIEKGFLVEVDSLDNEKGCYASNAHFSDFLGVSKSRVSQIVKALKDKGFIKTYYLYGSDGKSIDKRIIKMTIALNQYQEGGIKDSNGGIKNTKRPIEDSNGGIKNTKGGYLENCKGNNTSIKNTYKNTYKNTKSGEFENSNAHEKNEKEAIVNDDVKKTSNLKAKSDEESPKSSAKKVLAKKAESIMEYWNEITGQKRLKADGNLSLIVKILESGYTEDSLKRVIEYKSFSAKTDRDKYFLRPTTVFKFVKKGGCNFKRFLAEAEDLNADSILRQQLNNFLKSRTNEYFGKKRTEDPEYTSLEEKWARY